jgi:hypothetical protein
MCSWLPARNENLLGLTYCSWFWLGVSKKIEKPIKPRKPEKNRIVKKLNREKNRLN